MQCVFVFNTLLYPYIDYTNIVWRGNAGKESNGGISRIFVVYYLSLCETILCQFVMISSIYGNQKCVDLVHLVHFPCLLCVVTFVDIETSSKFPVEFASFGRDENSILSFRTCQNIRYMFCIVIVQCQHCSQSKYRAIYKRDKIPRRRTEYSNASSFFFSFLLIFCVLRHFVCLLGNRLPANGT